MFIFNPDQPMKAEIARIEDWATEIGVTLLTEVDQSLYISDLGRDISDPATKGNGKRVIDAILQVADHHQIAVEISHMTDEVSLGAYYRHFGFEQEGEPGVITNMIRKPLALRPPSPIPTISFYRLYHIGTLNAADKRSNSYEGAGLSVSLHPEDWAQIAKLGDGPFWSLEHAGNLFLNAHEVSLKLKHEIISWALAEGLAQTCDLWRWRRIDEETLSPMISYFQSHREALFESTGDGARIGTIRKVSGHRSTPLLDRQALQTRTEIGTENVLDLLLPLYADRVLDLDGVWWQDQYAPEGLSAPRGVIGAARLQDWTISPLNASQNQLAA